MTARAYTTPRRAERGFTLVEVMIALLVLAFGLLGFGLLQAMNVRFTNSANQRSQATNLAYDVFDQMRANQAIAAQYAGDYAADESDCAPEQSIGPDQFRKLWQCRLHATLGEGAKATVAVDGRAASVDITWVDQRWNPANASETTFVVRTAL